MNSKLTPFGKAVRKLRIEANTRILDMADWLKKSSAYVSAMETGRKNISTEYVGKVIQYFQTLGIDASELMETIDISQKEYRINIEGQSEDSRKLVAAFARKFPTMNEDEKKDFFQRLVD